MNLCERQELSASMARLADGDRHAFTGVFARLWPELRRFAVAFLHDEVEAEDAAQRALLAIMMRAHEYDPQRDALSWAIGITAWECRTSRRRIERRRTDGERELVLDRSSPEAEAVARDLERAVLEVVGTLSAVDRAALGLETSDPDPMSSTIRKRRQRALMRLRAAWSRIHGEP
jgi:DNA-directed RNA polymerase specialized sigma24 family protein